MRNLYCAKVLFTALLGVTVAASQPLDEARVFEWWDNGMIDGDEAKEILERLEEGNMQEACILAEVYALENCALSEAVPESDQNAAPKKNVHPGLAPHGYAEWRGRTDSTGHLESQRAELHLNFYRYTLRLGTQSLLTYKNAGSEAHFGQISTKEIRSAIPLDTLWGTALLYPIGKFRIGALLDTATTTRANIGFAPDKKTELELAFWQHRHTGNSENGDNSGNGDTTSGIRTTEKYSVSAQFKGNWGNLAAWWIPENKGNFPLFKLQLHHRENTEYATVGWNADAYLHGESLPRESHLSTTIEKSRFWGSQTFAVTAVDSWKSKFGVNARTIIPLEGDSSKTRIKASATTGPAILRSEASATCTQAEERCRQNDLALKVKSTWNVGSGTTRNRMFKQEQKRNLGEKAAPNTQRTRRKENVPLAGREQLVFTGKIRSRHTRGQGFAPPLYEAGATYAADAFNSAGVAVAFPKGSPARELQIRSSAEVGTDILQLSLAVTFRRTAETPLHPLHAAFFAKIHF